MYIFFLVKIFVQRHPPSNLLFILISVVRSIKVIIFSVCIKVNVSARDGPRGCNQVAGNPRGIEAHLDKRCPVAQLVSERTTFNRVVAGSSPARGIFFV